MSHELEMQQVGFDDVVIAVKSVTGGALRMTAKVMFAAEITIPAHSRQDEGTKARCRDNLRAVVRDRFYGDVRRHAVKLALSIERLVERLSPGYELTDVDMADIFPLLNAGDVLCPRVPACPCCGSNERVTASPAESRERGMWFCPCNEPGGNGSGHFNAGTEV